jgi:hypothetical protein
VPPSDRPAASKRPVIGRRLRQPVQFSRRSCLTFDGVLTDTASRHQAAWQRLFDAGRMQSLSFIVGDAAAASSPSWAGDRADARTQVRRFAQCLRLPGAPRQ